MGPGTGDAGRFGGEDEVCNALSPLLLLLLLPLLDELEDLRMRSEPNALSRGETGMAQTRAGEALRLADEEA